MRGDCNDDDVYMCGLYVSYVHIVYTYTHMHVFIYVFGIRIQIRVFDCIRRQGYTNEPHTGNKTTDDHREKRKSERPSNQRMRNERGDLFIYAAHKHMRTHASCVYCAYE